MPQTTRQQTGQRARRFAPPSWITEGQDYRDEEERKRGTKQIGATYRNLSRRLAETAGKHGFLGAGAHATKEKQLALEQAASEIGLQRDIASRRATENLGWATGERGYEQRLGAMGAGYGYQSQLMQQQQGGQMDIAQLQAELQRELATQGWSEKAQMLQNQLASQENIAGGQLELGYGELGERGRQFDIGQDWEREQWGGQMGLQEREMAMREQALAQQAEQYYAGLEHQTGMQQAGFGEAALQRGWQSGERMGTQDWTGQQAQLQRDFQTSFENLRHNFAERDQLMQAFYDMHLMSITDPGWTESDKKLTQNYLNQINSFLPEELQVNPDMWMGMGQGQGQPGTGPGGPPPYYPPPREERERGYNPMGGTARYGWGGW